MAPPHDHSKRASYIVWCNDCKEEIRISIKHNRQKLPKHCPFNGCDILVESIRTQPRAA